jgi:hypothetical protein
VPTCSLSLSSPPGQAVSQGGWRIALDVPAHGLRVVLYSSDSPFRPSTSVGVAFDAILLRPNKERDMSKPFACWIGLHAWCPIESEPEFPLIACLRCGKQETPRRSAAARLGWNQHHD